MCGRSIASSDAREHWCCRGKGGPRPALPANPGGQSVTDVLTQDVTHVMTSNTFRSDIKPTQLTRCHPDRNGRFFPSLAFRERRPVERRDPGNIAAQRTSSDWRVIRHLD